MSPDTAAGPTQLGYYDVVDKIAEGGMGTVYKARHRKSGEVVAIKVIAPATAKNPVLLQRFEREFLSAKVLDHPNIVRAIEYCGTGSAPFLVMEYVDGESVGQRIERGGAIPETDAIKIVAQVCDGLQRAHKQGLVHRDVKPDNILIARDGVAKLADMGLVKDAEADLNLTKTGRGLGTPHYMAPEQFRNAKGVDIRGDIYSIGATLYAMVTGEIPFNHTNPLDCWMKKIRNEFPTPKELNPNISDRVDWAIRRAMSAEVGQRPATCREFIEDLTGQSRVTGPAAARTVAADVWYLVYKDETGKSHTVKGGTDAIRKALGDGLLGDASTIVVGRSKSGQFQPLFSVAEFRDLVVSPAAMSGNGKTPSNSGVYAKPAGAARRSGANPAVEMDTAPAELRGSSTSGRYAAKTGGGRTPSPQPLTVRTQSVKTPRELDDPKAETTDYTPAPSTPAPMKRPLTPAQTPAADEGKPGFDWTPVVMIVVALASALFGYLLLKH